jgi:hypothetical protein
MLDTAFLNNVTREHFIPGLRNQIYDEFVMMQPLLQAGIQTAVGRSLIHDVVLKRNEANGQWTGYSFIATQESNPTVQGSLNWARYYASVSISSQEEDENSGSKEKLLDMLEVKFNNAKMTLKENLYKDIFLALTTRDGHNTLVGLNAIIDTNNTYAGIDRTAAGNSDWQSNQNTSVVSDANLKDSTNSGYLPTVMRNLWLNATHDSSPTLGITTTNIYEIYQFIGETQNLRFGNDTVNFMFDKAKLGPNFTLRFDKYTTTKHLFLINPADFKVYIFPNRNFDGFDDGSGMWQRGQNQFARSMQIVWSGQLICLTPRHQASATALGS